MDLKPVPTLENLSCVKISVAIISNPAVSNLNFKPICDYTCITKNVLDVLNKNISALTLPANCCDKIKVITMNMINEVVEWRINNSNILNRSVMSVANLCWTPFGAIDELQTARKLLNRTDLRTESRFLLACKYCFFYNAVTLWVALLDKGDPSLASDSLLGYWIYNNRYRGIDLISNIADNTSHIKFWIEDLLRSFLTFVEPRIEKCNIHTFRFILENISPAERTQILRTMALSDTSPHLRYFCLQQLDEDAQQEVVEKFPLEVLKCFLQWPLQNNFLHLADRIWDKITPRSFCDFIEQVLMSLRTYFWRNFAIVEILQQLWCRSPENFKDLANQQYFSSVLRKLLNCKGLRSLKSYVLEKEFSRSKGEQLQSFNINFEMYDDLLLI